LAAFKEFWSRLDQTAAADEGKTTPRRAVPYARKALVAGAALLAVAAGVLWAAGRLQRGTVIEAPSQSELPSQQAPITPPPLPPAAAPSANPEGGWLESVEIRIQASVAQAGDDCFSAAAARLVEAAYTLKQFRETALGGKLCGARLIVVNRTAGSIVIGLAGLSEGGGTGMRTLPPGNSDYLILGPSHRNVQVLVRNPQRDDANFSGRLFSSADGVDGTAK
jgi:hypothetical protein